MQDADGEYQWPSTCVQAHKNHSHTHTQSLEPVRNGVQCTIVAHYNVWSAVVCSNTPSGSTVKSLLLISLSLGGDGSKRLCAGWKDGREAMADKEAQHACGANTVLGNEGE